jgi:hypothetical protein
MYKIFLLFLLSTSLFSFEELEHRFFFINDLMVDSGGVPINTSVNNYEMPSLIKTDVPNNDKVRATLSIQNTDPSVKEKVLSLLSTSDESLPSKHSAIMELGDVYVINLLFAVNSISDASIQKIESIDVPTYLSNKNAIVIKPISGNIIELLSMNKKVPISDQIVIQKDHNKLTISFSKIKGVIF